MIQKARIVCYGVNDELRDDASSIFSTDIKSLNYPVPAPIAPNLAPIIENTRTGVEAVGFTTRLNTKRFKYSLNPNLKNLNLSKKARLVIESITIPNIISDTYLQSKCVNNVILKLKGISNHNIWDSSTQGKGSSVIFTCPILLNTQGFGTTLETNVAGIGASQPDLITSQQKPRLNCDNNGYLFINTSPSTLYNFPITEDFFKNGILEFELIYDIGNIKRLTNLIGGVVNTITLTANGANYTTAPTITFSNDGGGNGATASADVGFAINGEIIITNTGTGYTADPTITFSAPGLAGTTALGNAVRGFPVATTARTNAGTGYTSAPQVVFTEPPPTTNATATATVDAGLVNSISITNNGLGYFAQPTITFTGGGGTGAIATAVITNTEISSITITSGGTGYTTAPTITITGGGGTRATGTVSLTTNTLNAITITHAGSGYITAPTISFVGGGGTGGAFTATLGTTGSLKSITVTNAGVGYLTASTINIAGTGTNASASANLLAGSGTIRRINLLTGGSGYTTAPTLTFTGGGGGATQATGNSTISTTEAHYSIIPQSLNINNDKNDLEAFMISLIVIDEDDDDAIYKDKKLLNKLNKLLLDKPI